MTRYSIDVLHDIPFAATVAVDAAHLEEACRLAIDEAYRIDNWKSGDASEPYILDIAAAADDPSEPGPAVPLPVPDAYTRDGPPPTIAIDPDSPPGAMEVSGGTVRVRFVHPSFAVTTHLSDPPPPPASKPVVTVAKRPDGTPHISVTGGTVHVRVTGWENPAMGPPPSRRRRTNGR